MSQFYVVPPTLHGIGDEQKKIAYQMRVCKDSIDLISKQLYLDAKGVDQVLIKLNNIVKATEENAGNVQDYGKKLQEISSLYSKTEQTIYTHAGGSGLLALNAASIEALVSENNALLLEQLDQFLAEHGISKLDFWNYLYTFGGPYAAIPASIGKFFENTSATLIDRWSAVVADLSLYPYHILDLLSVYGKDAIGNSGAKVVGKVGSVLAKLNFAANAVNSFDKNMHSDADVWDAFNNFYGNTSLSLGSLVATSGLSALIYTRLDQASSLFTGSSLGDHAGNLYSNKTGNIRQNLNSTYENYGLLPYVAAIGTEIVSAISNNGSNSGNVFKTISGAINSSAAGWAALQSISDQTGLTDLIEKGRAKYNEFGDRTRESSSSFFSAS